VKPLLFLDVDGVINAVDRTLDVETVERKGYAIRFQPWLRECLLELHEHFEVVWCTTWEEDAEPSFAEVLGLPGTRDRVQWATRRMSGISGDKLPALERYAGDRPWAFIDDDAAWELTRHEVTAPTYLIVEPDPKVGLTRAHTDQLITFAREVS